ncbi:CobN component of cobalt chelatase [Cutibacterium acnes JCM 18918]|nr:CobN component of cobalt chelatase [Cutibacterium acnes JCM 18918]
MATRQRLGLSEECYPELALDRMVNIYPYIINNPGEAPS